MEELNNNPFIGVLCSYLVGTADLNTDTKQFKFIMTGDGVKKVVKNRIGTFVTDTKNVPGLEHLDNGVTLAVPKIPYTLFNTMIEFFKRVMREKGGAEAMLQFFFDSTECKYIAYCPQQTVSGAHITFERNEDMEKKHVLVAEFHSHNSMSAFFSSIDNADEKRTMIFGVVGKLDKPTFEYKVRMSISGEYAALDLNDIFDAPISQEAPIDSWMEKCIKAPETINCSSWMDRDSDYKWVWDETKRTYKRQFVSQSNNYNIHSQLGSRMRLPPVGDMDLDDLDDLGDEEQQLPDNFDITKLSDLDLDILLKNILYNRFEDLVSAIIEENLFDELQTEAIRQVDSI